MMRRFISVILTLAICVGLLSIPACASDNIRFINIKICQGDTKSYCVIEMGRDLLFSGEDLSKLTGYDYENDGNTAVFTRGCKTVKVDVSKNTLLPMEELTLVGTVKLSGKVQHIGDTYYFPGSELLPWLNVTCLEQDGVFYVVADAVSLWDFAADFKPELFKFDFLSCCSILKVNSKWLKAAAYARNNGLGAVFDAIPVSFDYTYGSYTDYFDIFDEMFQNKDSSVYAFKALTGQSKKVSSAFDMLDQLGTLDDLPDDLQALVACNKGLSKVSDAADYAVYYTTFQQDNTEKLAMMDAITLNRAAYKDYPPAMITAAIDVANSYRSLWDGLVTRFMQNLTEDTVKELISAGTNGKLMETALKTLGVYKAFKPSWSEGVDRISKYDAIAACGLDVLEENFGGSHVYTIQLQRCHAMLYLYACEQNYRAMATYAASKGENQTAENFTFIADAALEWEGKFLASARAAVNDSHEYGEGHAKEEYTTNILEMFAKLDKTENPDSDFGEIEYAFVLGALKEMGVNDLSWSLTDADGDGAREQFIQAKASANGWTPSLIIVDSGSGKMWSYSATGAAGSSEFCSLSGEDNYIWHDNYSTLGTQMSIYYRWSGAGWQVVSSLNGGSNQDENGTFVFSGESKWYGDDVSIDEYNEKESAAASPASFDSPDLGSITVSGNASDILSRLDDYFKNRDGFKGSADADVDGDGQSERVYMIRGAASRWFGSMDIKNYWGDESFLNYIDEKFTAVVADSASGSVTLRTVRLNTDSNDFSLSGGMLTVGGMEYAYTTSDSVFERAGVTSVIDLMGMTYAQAKRTIEGCKATSGENVVGKLGSASVTLSFSPPWEGEEPADDSIVLSVYANDYTGSFGSTPVTASATMGMTVAELRNILTPSTEWSEFYSSQDVLSIAQLLYLSGNKTYSVTIYIDERSENGRLGAIRFTQNLEITPEEAAALGLK